VSLNFRNTGLIISLVAIAAGSWYFVGISPAPPETQKHGDPTLGYYLNGAVIVGTDENGAMLYEIRADRVEEIPDAEHMRLAGVEVAYSDTQAVPWNINATRAEGPLDNEYLDLEGRVVLVSDPHDGGEPLTIETTNMRLEPRSHLVRTPEQVRLVVGKTWLVATGMQIHLKEDRIELESSGYGRVTK
jgi:LPS export ABC transporter protein LptC